MLRDGYAAVLDDHRRILRAPPSERSRASRSASEEQGSI
jgi:hypothetical protein